MWCIYTMEYYSAIGKNELIPFAAMRMDLQIILLSEGSHTEKDKYHMTFICGILKTIIQMNLQYRKRLTDVENELIIALGKDEGRDS